MDYCSFQELSNSYKAEHRTRKIAVFLCPQILPVVLLSRVLGREGWEIQHPSGEILIAVLVQLLTSWRPSPGAPKSSLKQEVHDMTFKEIPPRTVGEGFFEAFARFSEGDHSTATVELLRNESEAISSIYLDHISSIGEVIAEGVKSERVERAAIASSVNALREFAVMAHVGIEAMLRAQAILRRREHESACK